MKYKDYNDNELISYIAESNEEANEILYEKYRPLIIGTANKMYKSCKYTGIEMNDLIQEGMLGLNQAIKHFSDNKDASFYTFAKTCIERRMLSMLISSKRLKNKILNESVSLDIETNDGANLNLEEFIGSDIDNPDYRLINKEAEDEMLKKIESLLTPFEKKVFLLKISGFDYIEIGALLSKPAKSIDNALQRIKTKIKKGGYYA